MTRPIYNAEIVFCTHACKGNYARNIFRCCCLCVCVFKYVCQTYHGKITIVSYCNYYVELVRRSESSGVKVLRTRRGGGTKKMRRKKKTVK